MPFFFAMLLALAAPTTLVDTFVGTSGTPVGGPIDTFPGADLPFGMVQWSPDTPSQNAGGGYEYNDEQITGLSLTHLSGPGCNVFGDFGILPIAGALPSSPATASAPFSHASEESAPGWYVVSLGEPAVRAELTVTMRTGIGRFTFPATSQANLLVNVASNQAGVLGSEVRIDGSNEISGSATSGFFCGMPDQYTVYFVAQFDRPFRAHGTWQAGRLFPDASSAQGPAAGTWLTFDATQNRQVQMKVGLSFVSAAGARANLAAENSGWNLIGVRDRATEKWSAMLRRIAIDGGTTVQQKIFYTAFYHTLLHPNVISDVTGAYRGFDGRVHHVAAGHAEYANYSDWDIYRTEVPLLALIAPGETSDMMQSLVDAYRHEGWLPRWPLVAGTTSVMGGDSVDAVIGGAYAFGARAFDARGALAAMIKGATSTQPPPAQGWYFERWELHDQYLQRGYVVNTHTTSVAPVPNGASETLEYALDDFAISRLALAIGDRSAYRDFFARSSNWATLFDAATGWIAPRDPDGAFMQTPLTENGQSGFQEGNAAQYTWMVPQDLRDLVNAMGGARAAVAKLDAFFTQLNAGEDKPYAWLGNEPSIGTPWVYLSAGEPWRAQAILRQAMTTLYNDTPDGLPGNDDLGTMSAWYVWCAMGLYPQNPAMRYLDIGAPLFRSVRVESPSGFTLEISASNAASNAQYVEALRVDGRASNKSWIALPDRGNLRLDVTLGATTAERWATDGADAPPSYALRAPAIPASTAAAFVEPTSAIVVRAGDGLGTPVTLDVSNRLGETAADLTWRATLPHGLTVDDAGGRISVEPHAERAVDLRFTADGALGPGYYDVRFDGSAQSGARLEHLDLPVRVARRDDWPTMAYATNRFGNSVTPIDLTTGVAANEIAVGEEPRIAVLSADGNRLYVVDSGAGDVSIVDTHAGKRIATVKTGGTPMDAALTPDGKTLWVASNDDGTVQAIDTATLHAGATVHVGFHPRALAIDAGGSTLYVSNSWSNSVTPIDLRTNAAEEDIPVGLRPAGIAISPDGKRLYVVESASNDVTVIDLDTRRTVARVPVGVDPLAIAISPDGHVAYVSNHANSTITPIDPQTNEAAAPIEVGGAPLGIIFTAGGKRALVLLSRDNAAVFVDVAARRASQPIPLGNGPYGVAGPPADR
ncbi:MAG: GH92 family glycosyl hydrolase [Candidatus Cybelea sp.]